MNLLVAGAGSYIGEKVSSYIIEKEPTWNIFQLDVQTDEWRKHDFSKYDTVFHVAGLAHRKITPEIEPLYYKVNRDLAIEIAKKAKESRIVHYIFMSSMSVYSDGVTYIDQQTPTKPDNVYGNSKLQAEQGIMPLADDDFKVSILRPPMIYGKGCKGNYNFLRSLALNFPMFPKVNNKRSMLYIDNLSEFVRLLICKPRSGIFFPQNKELVNTSRWAKLIAEENHKKFRVMLKKAECLSKYIPGISSYCIKAFGDSYYDLALSDYNDMPYQVIGFEESIRRTEK